jgi:hypothetical protein
MNLNVSFEIESQDRAKAFVNDVCVGNVRLMTVDDALRLTFRCNDNPFKNFVRNPLRQSLRPDLTVAEAIDNRSMKIDLIAIVIRNYLYNYAQHVEAA